MSSPAVTRSATLSTMVIRSRIAVPLTSKRDSTRSVRAVLGTLPLASRRTTVQSIVRAKPWTRLPPVLVAAAKSKSVPTAVAGWIPNKRMSSGVMSDPPPTPVIPTNRPPKNPHTEYSGSIAYMAGLPLGSVATEKSMRQNCGAGAVDTDLIELSTSHSRRQLKRTTEQARELAGQRTANSDRYRTAARRCFWRPGRADELNRVARSRIRHKTQVPSQHPEEGFSPYALAPKCWSGPFLYEPPPKP